jgi:hypothetical protein
MDDKGVEKVCVTKPSALIEKWVSVDNLLSWNSANEKKRGKITQKRIKYKKIRFRNVKKYKKEI